MAAAVVAAVAFFALKPALTAHAQQPPGTTAPQPAAPAVPPHDPSGNGTGSGSDLAGVSPGTLTASDFASAQKSEPFAVKLADLVNQNRLGINFTWVLVTGYLVMFMQAGFALVETGFCRAKSALHVMMTNFMIYGLGMLAYFLVGFAFQFGGIGLVGVSNLGGLAQLNKEWTWHLGGVDWGILGYKGFFLTGSSYDVGIAVLFLFQMVFMDTAATIPTGAMAERWKWTGFCIYGLFIGAIIYPVFGNWAWGGGWLSQLGTHGNLGNGYLDFAGSGVVHAVGGWTALAGALVLGPRLGKFNRDGSANAIPGHNLILAALGTFILAFGWFGFNPGSTLGAAGNGNLRIGMVAVVTMLSGMSGSVVAMSLTWAQHGKPDAGMMINGLLAGLVAITAPSGYVSPPAAVVIGAIAGGLVVYSVAFFENVLKVDDPVGAISVHGVNGMWGQLALGIFADGTANYGGLTAKGALFGDFGQLGAQAIGAVVCFAWAFGVSWVFFKVLMSIGALRSKPEDEIAGLDIPEMGGLAYNWDEEFARGIWPMPPPQARPSAGPLPAGG
ncbi:MAG: ammonium transporter [Chloroflexota bacterium]|nr:ammonium transporter [Chloroflexota bacterium]